MKKGINRRDFLKNSALLSSSVFLGASALSAKSYSNIIGANDRINFAVVGVRSRANAHLKAIKECDKVNLTHICEVDTRYEREFSAKVKENFGKYSNYL